MDFTKLFVGGALLGTLASCWSTIKSLAWKICNVLVRKIDITETFSPAILLYLRENYKYTCLHDKTYDNFGFYTKNNKIYEQVGAEIFTNCSLVFWDNKVPFFYYQVSTSKKDEKTNATLLNKKTTIYYLRGTINLENIIQKATDNWNNITIKQSLDDSINKRFYITYVPGNKKGNEVRNYDLARLDYKILTHNKNNLGLFVNPNAVENLILTKENENIIRLGELWKKNKDWYKSKDIPWKMGWLLHGPPGTGKTSIARAIAEHLNMPIFVYKLAILGDEEFSEEWAKMQTFAPCVALIEDFDNIFNGREYIAGHDMFMGRFSLLDNEKGDGGEPGESKKRRMGRPLSFDNLLNTLDGAERYEGILTIITTNHIDKIDPALLNRPGRIDKVVELTYLTEENKVRMINKILGNMTEAKRKMLEYITLEKGLMTPAQLQEKCTEFALKEFYESFKVD